MLTLTNEQLDQIIARADAQYDELMGVPGDYDRYHEIAADIAEADFGVEDYSPLVVDTRVQALAEDAKHDHDCDAEVDAYSRRFDCEV